MMDTLNPHSCSCCREIVIYYADLDVESQYTYTVDCITTNAKTCAFFKWAQNLLDGAFRPSQISKGSSHGEITFCWNHDYLVAEWRTPYFGTSTGEESEVAGSLCLASSKLHIFIREDDGAAEIIKSRPLAGSKAEPEDLKRYQNQLQNCLGHEDCNKFLGGLPHPTPPTRLLSVERGSSPRLYIVCPSQCPPYAALSYFWGHTPQQEQAKTIRTNLQDRHTNVRLTHLPQTVRDAVEVTLALELSYLWVDALCIIQDDKRDMETEIAKMGSIYRSATVTIAAASSESGADGFLGDRDLTSAYGDLFQLLYHYKRGAHEAHGLVFLCERQLHDQYKEHIDTRAWTMQEDILSVRLLRFGSVQTTWRCPSAFRTIDGGRNPRASIWSTGFVHGRYEDGKAMDTASKESSGTLEAWEAWQNSIKTYTQRILSDPEDRYIACAALAERFAARCGLSRTDYYAGLWKDDLPAQLLWFRSSGSEARRQSAPTWSWASISGPVKFHFRHYLEQTGGIQARAKLDDSKSMYDFQGHSFADIQPACLWLNGALVQVYCDGYCVSQNAEFVSSYSAEIQWDLPKLDIRQTVWFFEIGGASSGRFEDHTLGLVLKRVDETGFERIGCFRSKTRSLRKWLDNAGKRTICLV